MSSNELAEQMRSKWQTAIARIMKHEFEWTHKNKNPLNCCSTNQSCRKLSKQTNDEFLNTKWREFRSTYKSTKDPVAEFETLKESSLHVTTVPKPWYHIGDQVSLHFGFVNRPQEIQCRCCHGIVPYSPETGYPGRTKRPPCLTSSATTPPPPPPPGTKRRHRYLATINRATSGVRKWHDETPGDRHNVFIACKGNKRQRPPRPFFCKCRMMFCCWNRDVWVLPRASRRPKERAMDWGQSTASSTDWRKHRSKSPASSNEYSCLTENDQRKKRCTRMSRHFAANLAVSWSSSSGRIRWIRHHPNGHWSG